MTHTPTPWSLYEVDDDSGPSGEIHIGEAAGPNVLAHVFNDVGRDRQWANARLIVKAVNCHAGLLAALEALLPLADWALLEQSPPDHDGILVDQARAAIVRAKED